jgi:Xaa-Pro aminopeptidase
VVESSYDETLAGLLGSGSLGSQIGFESAHLSVARHTWLQQRLESEYGPTLIPAEGLIERARITKDAYEQSALREAARRLTGVAIALLEQVRPGRTEREVAGLIESLLRNAGFERPAFETIVAGGPNAALPHARPGERTLSEGDLVVLDFGGVYDSYCVDLTRTVSVGRASARAREVYQAVLDAHDQAIAAVRPGVLPFVIDQAARDLLTARGMGEAFGHGTGHGLGIEVHEEPRVSQRRATASPDEMAGGAVAPGMVFTIEPGAYFPGWGGVRIEDDVLVTADGVEVLTNVPTVLVEI